MTRSEPDIWAFDSVTDMSPEQRQRWFETCYIETNVDSLFADPMRSIIVMTHSGCGITTSLARLRSYGLLAFTYDPDQWPGQSQAFTSATDHFGQWMSHVAFAFIEQLRQQPPLLEQLNLAKYEFLTWIVRRYLNRNQQNRWLQFLQARLKDDVWQSVQAAINSDSFNALFGNAIADIVGQIDESLDLAHSLGWQGIYASIDIRWADWVKRTPQQRKELRDSINHLLTTLTPLQRPGFGFKMGLPQRLFAISEARALLRGRAQVVNYDWSADQLSEIAKRLIFEATSDSTLSIQLLPDEMWQLLTADISSIWEMPGPTGAAALALHTLQLNAKKTNTLADLRRRLYQFSARLRMDNDISLEQVWRGMTPIKLTEAPFDVFKELWRYQGELVSNRALVDIAGSKENVDQNITRIRRAIEPFYKEKIWLYIRRDPNRGAWLDKDSCHFD